MDGPAVDTHSVLVVGDRDDHAAILARGLRRHGHTVLGPVETVEDALALLEGGATLDGAVFDLPRGADWSSPIAEALRRRGVPFVFTAPGGRSMARGDVDAVEEDAARQIVDVLFGRARRRPSSFGTNRLLAMMPLPLAERLRPRLVPAELSATTVLQEPDTAADSVHFPLTAVLSVVGPASPRRPGAEIALIGFEGVTGIADILGGQVWPFATIVLVGGDTLAMETHAFRQLLRDEPEIRHFLLGFVQAFLVQTGDTALANARGVLGQRLARRILMTHDRLGSDVLPLTHQQLATMLGVRRASVTEALHLLEGDGVVRSLRGRLLVRNRTALLEIATGYYGAAESAYERLLGTDAIIRPQLR